MENLIERFTLECRTNKSGKLKKFKPKNINKEKYKIWKADANVMLRDAILANKAGLSYPRQLELIHGTIERILKTFVIQRYGIKLSVHETAIIYDAIKKDLVENLRNEDYFTLRMLDSKFIIDRYPVDNRFYEYEMIEDGFEVLININKIVDESLELSKRAKIAIEEAEREISIDREL
ncbi:hypothetical protein [Clostridium tarantellae]|uniref:HEPN domain-containing protein n=1 Tax=Clostridium tarantellae TaxID=39493 RepID=A0A6I1MR93_9CLOT|nr:hypothetical protein [Clostridium tarantellae]MPQ44988.1 hypothetical protein [Clostridium tarantellae]